MTIIELKNTTTQLKDILATLQNDLLIILLVDFSLTCPS